MGRNLAIRHLGRVDLFRDTFYIAARNCRPGRFRRVASILVTLYERVQTSVGSGSTGRDLDDPAMTPRGALSHG